MPGYANLSWHHSRTGTLSVLPARKIPTLCEFYSRLNRVHRSWFYLFVKIVPWYTVRSTRIINRVNKYFYIFASLSSLSLSRDSPRVGGASSFRIDRWINSRFCRIVVVKKRLKCSMHGVSGCLPISRCLHTTCTRFELGTRSNSQTVPSIVRRIGQGFSCLRIPTCRAICKCERRFIFFPTSYTVWHFVNCRKTPGSCTLVSDNTKMENLCNDNAQCANKTFKS